jgi:ribonuclease BN (tRNA processing enzyme)
MVSEDVQCPGVGRHGVVAEVAADDPSQPLPLVDCGVSVIDQYGRTGIPFSALRSIFITHHHADHNIEYGPLLVIGWINGMHLDVRAFGPPPLKRMTEDFLRAYKTTVDFWAEDLKMTPLVTVDVKEVSAAGPVMQDDNLKVSAIIVEHPPVKPALAYRFDFKDRSIAFSGDTAPFEGVAKMARGADILVHKAMYVPGIEAYIRREIAKGRPIKFEDLMAHMKADHTPVEDVGRIAQEAGSDADSWEVVRRLKTDAQTGRIPIIGMSAYALDSEREKAIASGCNEFDAKPIDFEALVGTIRRLVENPK